MKKIFIKPVCNAKSVSSSLSKKYFAAYGISFLFVLLLTPGCKKLVDIGLSRNAIDPSAAYADSANVQATVSGIYSLQYNSFNTDQPYGAGISYLNGVYTDDLTSAFYPLYQNNALPTTDAGASAIWVDSYASIYRSNSVIEGVQASKTISAGVRNQAIGEAKFLRAFCHFNLVNTYGNVPLITTTNVSENANAPQTPAAAVYQQIISDLTDAVAKLPASYSVSNNERIRANKFAASALLAKVYLYTGDWVNAEAQATSLISNTTSFSLLTDLNKIYQANNSEAIFQFDSKTRGFAFIANSFTPAAGAQPRFILTASLLNAFETGDLRKTNWIGTSAGFSYPAKAKMGAGFYDVVLRLGEQYLIRAEARAQQNNVSGSQADLNAIRTRAGLPNTTATDKPSLLLAIEKERRIELFAEWANRFFDLKRTNRIDAVLNASKPGIWNAKSALYPIPAIEISKNLNLVQNTGY